MHLSPSIGHDLVTGTRFMGAFTMFALSILLAFVNRGKTQLKVYNQARWLIFTGCLLLCIFNLVQFLGNFREQSITLSWAITTMFLVAIIPPIFLGNLFLLRAGHDMKPHIWRSVIFVAFCYGLFFYGLTNDLLIDDVEPHTTVTFYIALALFAKITQMAIVLHRGLKKTSSSLTDGELQQRHVALRYTSHAMNAMLVVTVIAPWVGLTSSTLLYTITKLTLLMTLSWLVCEFCLYGYNMAETIEVNDEIREAQLMEGERPSTDISEHATRKIEAWVDARHYTDPSLTIGTALKQMGVSASTLNAYLSSNTDASNFRKWLPYLRIEEAKRQMTQHPELTLQAIAEASGYANHPNFTRAFKTKEGISPTEWITNHKNNKSNTH